MLLIVWWRGEEQRQIGLFQPQTESDEVGQPVVPITSAHLQMGHLRVCCKTARLRRA